MLFIIGIGLSDAKDISVKGLEAVRSCKYVYLETYTSKLNCPVKDLEQLYGKEVVEAKRPFVEDQEKFIQQAKEDNVALLIIGDALSATTHWEILNRAKESNIQTQVIHNASVFSAISSTGLQLYKFGKTVSIPTPRDNFKPTTAYHLIKQNRSIGAHTLCLLDTEPKFMTINDAIKILLDIENAEQEGVFLKNTPVVGVARLGSSDQKILAGTAEQLLAADFGPPVHSLIIPGKLHFLEEEALANFSLNNSF